MSIYTIAPDLLRNIEKDEYFYFTDILFVFCNRENTLKFAKDKDGLVIKAYEEIENNTEIISTWLSLLSFKPFPFEEVIVDLDLIDCEETKFLKVCKSTLGQNKIIFYTKQNVLKNPINSDSIISFENTNVLVLDKDEARKEINLNSQIYNIQNSQVALNNSQLNNSNNNNEKH